MVTATTEVGIRELLEAGVHFGHQTRRWHPKMRRYIFGERDGIYIIDLLQTVDLLERARAFAEDLASKGGVILFVGTKKQAKDTTKEIAEEAGMLHVNERWLGGLPTTVHTMRNRSARLHEPRGPSADGRQGGGGRRGALAGQGAGRPRGRGGRAPRAGGADPP